MIRQVRIVASMIASLLVVSCARAQKAPESGAYTTLQSATSVRERVQRSGEDQIAALNREVLELAWDDHFPKAIAKADDLCRLAESQFAKDAWQCHDANELQESRRHNRRVGRRFASWHVACSTGTSEQFITFPRFQKTVGPLRANSLVLGR